MANTSSAKKAMRQALRRAAVNKTRRTRMRSVVRQVEEAIAAGDKDAAMAAFRTAQPIVARTGQKGVIHANAASRKISRLAQRIKAMEAAGAAAPA